MTTWIGRVADRARVVRERDPIEPRRKVASEAIERPLEQPKIRETRDALSELGSGMEPHRARQFTRTIEGFYKTLGKTIAKLPEDERAAVSEASLAAMRTLVEEVGIDERLMPAIATLASLLEKRGKHEAGQLAKNAPEALAAALAIATAQEGRAGGHTALHLYRNLVEVLERRTKELTATDRPELWREVAAFIDRASPSSGIDQTQAANLNVSVLGALGAGASWKDALAQAEQQVIAARAPAQRAAIDQITAIAAAIPAGHGAESSSRALIELLERNPVGEDALFAAAQSLMAQLSAEQGRITEQTLPIVEDIAAICRANARNPAAAPILEHLRNNLGALLGKDPNVLARARADASRVALALIEAQAGELPAIAAALDPLSPALATRCALALLPYLNAPELAAPLAGALADRAKHASDQEELDRFAQKVAASLPVLQPLLAEDAGPIAAELAKSHGAAVHEAELQKLAALANAVKAALPEVALAPLIARDGAGRPGLSDLKGELRHDPLPLLQSLLATIGELGAKPKEQSELARRAIGLARESAMIDRDIALAFPRIEQDWRAGLLEPERLTFIGKPGRLVAVRAQQQKSGLDFLESHALPVELAFSAGLHLNAQQLGWVLGRIESFRNHGHIRILRDLVFAAIEAQRLDLIDAFAEAKLDQKSLMADAEMVAVEFRQGRLQELPIDLVIEKLRAGESAAAAIASQRGVGDFALAGADGVRTTPAGRAELERWKTQLEALIKATPPDGNVYADKGKNWRDPLMAVIEAIGGGNWPAWKFENDVGKRQVAGLTKEQLEIWMTDEITGTLDPQQAQRPEVQRAFQMLKGLKEALGVEVQLQAPGLEDLAWDQASFDRLVQQQSQLIARHRAAEKGSDEHRTTSAALGPITQRIAALELWLALERTMAQQADAATALVDTKGVLAAAQGPVRRLGGVGCFDAIGEILEVASTIRSSPKDGRHAVDENTLESFFQSYSGGCLKVPGGSNQVSLIEHIASAMYKVARTINAGQTEARGFARLHRFTFPGYEHGFGIQMDILRQTSGGQNLGEEAKRIMHQHLLAKAEAMNLPYLTNDPSAVELAKQKGLRVLEGQEVTFHVDHGHTGLHHAQNIDFNIYWILWKHAHAYNGLVQEPDDRIEADRVYTKHVILPRAVRLKEQP